MLRSPAFPDFLDHNRFFRTNYKVTSIFGHKIQSRFCVRAVLCSYLGGDIKRIRQAIIGGSLVPLLMFIACNAVALAVSPVTGGGDPLNIIVR